MYSLTSPAGIANVILHATLMATFLGIFFFTFGAFVERRVVDQQMDELAQTFTHMLVVLPEDQRSQVNATIRSLRPPDMADADRKASATNSSLIKRAALVIGIIFAVGIASVFGLWTYASRGFSLTQMLQENLITLFFVALTEAAFAWFILRNYRSADPNVVIHAVLEQFVAYAKTCRRS